MAVEQYRQYIRHLLSERQKRASMQQNAQEYEVQTIFDDQQDHYQLLYVGWRGNKRDFGCILHLDIKSGKIWIQHDGTEEGIANRLVEMGVPKQDIILAFHEPYVRQFTGFGTSEAL
ncbi:XisI protein [Scytonema sp. HK-05]|uniref:XisI protein n=1 Tax=Scytonema sp. HK-05 TaxID=1137095 RepID=UPI00093685FB|nr:XisI protein [Scytonema sp. HK-05]OKH52166.1 XisI protein [Scytonema sp. HK-05]BAY44423.1 XisI protein [Scytonema sp. HK-05]